MKLKSISWVIIFGGILFTLFLQSQVANGVYFSGDGGLKALLAKQLASGEFRFDLLVPEAKWIQNLWNEGLYPYNEPYVYQVAQKYYITFPYTFPLVTAPFYALFGERGLYLIPLISCWLVWVIFYWDCLQLKLSSFVTNVGLVILIFSSYLTIYSAFYWEHTLAIALAFTGLSLWFLSINNQSYGFSLVSGFLIAFAVWFRPEFICLVAIILALVLINLIVRGKLVNYPIKQQLVLVISMLLTVLSFFLTNKIIYGYAVGIHGIQVVEPTAISDRFIGAWLNFTGMSATLIEYFPVIIVPIFYGIFYLIQSLFFKNKEVIRFPLIYAIAYCSIILFMVGVSLLVPVGTAGLISGGKQWGVRFLLILVPVISLLIVVQLQAIKNFKVINYIILAILTILIAIGMQKNVVQATQNLIKNNQAIYPAVKFLHQDHHQYIAISHEFSGQALEAATLDQEVFFTIDSVPTMIQFAQALIKQKENQFIYICYPHRPCDLPQLTTQKLQFLQNNQLYKIQLNQLGKFGKYPIYQGNIIQK